MNSVMCAPLDLGAGAGAGPSTVQHSVCHKAAPPSMPTKVAPSVLLFIKPRGYFSTRFQKICLPALDIENHTLLLDIPPLWAFLTTRYLAYLSSFSIPSSVSLTVSFSTSNF